MSDNEATFDLPLIAILRGVEPDEVVEIGHALVQAGFRMVEVPLNSPDAIESIQRLVNAIGHQALVGAGTVRTTDDIHEVSETGAGLIVMPHADTRLVSTAKGEDLVCIPGVATITEAFDVLDAGADALKVFPAEVLGPDTIHAWRAVLPEDTIMLPVGGVGTDSIAEYLDAGADGFGLGSSIYSPGDTAEEVAENAAEFVAAWDELSSDDDDFEGTDDANEDDEAGEDASAETDQAPQETT